MYLGIPVPHLLGSKFTFHKQRSAGFPVNRFLSFLEIQEDGAREVVARDSAGYAGEVLEAAVSRAERKSNPIQTFK